MEKNWKKRVISKLRICKSLSVFVEELVSDYIAKGKDPILMEKRLASVLLDINAHLDEPILKKKIERMVKMLSKPE